MPNISLTPLPFTTDIIRPGAGPEQWHNGTARIGYPTESQPVSVENSLDMYERFTWAQFETAEGIYNWAFFDAAILAAMNKNQKYSFGIMTHRPEAGSKGSVMYGGYSSYYPAYLHNKMQAEASKDFVQQNVWMANYNSPSYLTRLFALNKAVRDHLVTTRLTPTSGRNAGKSILAGDAIYCIDIRGFGSWGEWHFGTTGLTWDTWPAGRQPTAASLKSIIDAHTQTFDQWPLVMMIAAYDGGYTGINVFARIPEVAHYALTARNAWGAVGFRRDQWGATDGYLHNLLAGNNMTYNGSVPFKTMILEKHKYAPVTGEPNPISSDMMDLLNQVNLYHATSIGNGNYGAYPADLAKRERIRTAFKRLGYKLGIESGTFTNTNTSVSVTLNLKNGGISPAYEDWNVEYLLSGIKHVSSFKPKLFQPSTVATPVTDSFTFNLPAGSYTLAVRVADVKGYREPMPIFNTGRQADGSYILGTVVVTTTQPNQGPVVSAGADQTITLPVNSLTVIGSATDPDGTIKSVKWEIVSGSGVIASAGTVSTMIAGLTEGITKLKFTGTDDKGATASDEMIITVKPAIVKPEKKILKITVPEYVVVFDDGSTEIVKGV